MRIELRDLVWRVDKEVKRTIYTNLDDTFIETIVAEDAPAYASFTSADYRRRMENLIHQHKNDLVVQKSEQLSRSRLMKQIASMIFSFPKAKLSTERSTKKVFEGKPLTELVRRMLGLEQEAANRIFNDFAKAAQRHSRANFCSRNIG